MTVLKAILLAKEKMIFEKVTCFARMLTSVLQASMIVEIMLLVPTLREDMSAHAQRDSQTRNPHPVKILTSVQPCQACVEQSLCAATLQAATSAAAGRATLQG